VKRDLNVLYVFVGKRILVTLLPKSRLRLTQIDWRMSRLVASQNGTFFDTVKVGTRPAIY